MGLFDPKPVTYSNYPEPNGFGDLRSYLMNQYYGQSKDPYGYDPYASGSNWLNPFEGGGGFSPWSGAQYPNAPKANHGSGGGNDLSSILAMFRGMMPQQQSTDPYGGTGPSDPFQLPSALSGWLKSKGKTSDDFWGNYFDKMFPWLGGGATTPDPNQTRPNTVNGDPRVRPSEAPVVRGRDPMGPPIVPPPATPPPVEPPIVTTPPVVPEPDERNPSFGRRRPGQVVGGDSKKRPGGLTNQLMPPGMRGEDPIKAGPSPRPAPPRVGGVWTWPRHEHDFRYGVSHPRRQTPPPPVSPWAPPEPPETPQRTSPGVPATPNPPPSPVNPGPPSGRGPMTPPTPTPGERPTSPPFHPLPPGGGGERPPSTAPPGTVEYPPGSGQFFPSPPSGGNVWDTPTHAGGNVTPDRGWDAPGGKAPIGPPPTPRAAPAPPVAPRSGGFDGDVAGYDGGKIPPQLMQLLSMLMARGGPRGSLPR